MSSVNAGAPTHVVADTAALPPVRLAASAATVLVQPTTLCNLDCAYCYLPDRAAAKRMPLAVADAVAAGVREWAREHPVRVLWHGGEPLAVGLPYFRRLLERFAAPGEGRDGGEHAPAEGGPYPVRHGVQTNATLIDEGWCELFASWPVAVDISIDGPGTANAARVDRGGRDSTAKALRGAALLRSAGIDFGLIAVVNDPGPRAARELYAFAVELGCRALGVNLAERKGVHTLPGPRAGGPVVAFWAELAACRRADPRVRVREFEQAYSYIRAELAGHAARRAARPLPPLPMVCHDGAVVPVSPELAGFTHPAYGSFATGNVLSTPLTRLVAEAPDVPWVAEALDGVRACRAGCQYFAYCRGGQAANKYFETGRMDTTETAHCRTTKIDLMEGILAHAQQHHRP
ncbi:cyclophane-forming radical SAM peptide maturase AmcB [Streptomyces sp. TS71-3]|uniref:cyclophane-forming radical SAM peptide maturase AmcB n=1 Tax=Streptomyces sp. TS71-3 TaxID=2733862 RepID=UPI001B00208D|nr:cyclophane-forming radical SAM peptide maturase AmcB [Streptomyces sp. TS71-3]GHJ35667.1 radical SAM protein [Streptomyces sp. TS71-3]